jgi:hypothetical protein
MNTDRNDDLIRLIRALEILNDDTNDPQPCIISEEIAEHRERILVRLRQSLAEHDWPQLTSTPPAGTNARNYLRSRAVRFLAIAVVAAVIYGVLGTLLAAWPQPDLIFLFLFFIGPSFLVFLWNIEARDPEVTHRSAVLDSRVTEFRQLQKRIFLLARSVVAERRTCEDLGLVAATSRLDSLGSQLRDARKSAKTLVTLLTEGSEEAQRFAETCRHDPYRACSEYDRPSLTIDSKRVGAEIDNLVHVLRIAGDVAVDIPLHIGIESKGSGASPDRAGEIAAELSNMFREVQLSGRFLRTEWRSTLRAFDTLHRLVTTRLLKTLTRGPVSRATARAAVAASVLPQSLARRPAARAAFLRAASASGNESCLWIGKAAVAAIAQGQKSA